jgi:hypothetical protein
MINALEEFLKQRTRVWASEITKMAKSLAPNHLKSHISSRTEFIRGGEFRIVTTVDNSNPTGPGHPNYGTSDAHAQEFGSGLRAKRGKKGEYPIIGNPFLVFPWDVATQNPEKFHLTNEGKVVLHQVMHPGIEATNEGQGYIGPAHKEIRKQIKEELLEFGPDAIRAELRKAFEGRRVR